MVVQSIAPAHRQPRPQAATTVRGKATEPPQEGRASVRSDEAFLSEPEFTVASPYEYGPDAGLVTKLKEYGRVLEELARTRRAPGRMIARVSAGSLGGIRQIRDKHAKEFAIPVEGIKKTRTGWHVTEISNPDDRAPAFDPYAFLPNLHFDPKEDSFPIQPNPDGDRNLLTDAARYRHGVIGDSQPMQGGFTVSKKGGYTVLTYSFYYVDNKAGVYHLKDSSTFSVYLKPNKAGTLVPKFLYTSWHFGANMVPWKDVKKGKDGRPIIAVERGSHALRPLSHKESVPTGGIQVNGKGQLSLNGKSLAHRLTFLAPQANVKNARLLDLAQPQDRVKMDAYFAEYPERYNPIHPILFGYGSVPQSWRDKIRSFDPLKLLPGF